MSELSKYYLDDRFIVEKIDGEIYLMARPSDEHIDVQGNILTIFNNYFRRNKKKCIARNEAQLNIDDDNYLVPDSMVFCFNTDRHIPLIVIEVLSKSTGDRDTGIKMKKYAEFGIKEYWIVDYKNCIINIYLLTDSGIYEKYKSYAYFIEEDFSVIPEIREKQQAEAVKEFSPVSIPELVIQLEDVFYFVD